MKLRIGYAIAGTSLEIPAYRRRFGYYLTKRNISWEVADVRKAYDVVVVHHSADITAWRDYTKGKAILDYNDAYLIGSGMDFKGFARGPAKFLCGHWRKLEFDYRKAYINMMRRADGIVCCTDAQEVAARKYCPNVHQIADMQADADWFVKEKYDSGSTFNLVWEGLPVFEGLKAIAPVLRRFMREHSSALHVITSLRHGRYLRDFFPVHTKDEITRKLHLNNVFLYEWNPYLFSHIAAACDLAIIPIDMHLPFWVSKPSNKLLFFWRMAMPALVDATPAYIKLMNDCGLDMVCGSADEWMEKLDRFSLDAESRRSAGLKAKMFVDQHYGEDRLLASWDSVLNSVI